MWSMSIWCSVVGPLGVFEFMQVAAAGPVLSGGLPQWRNPSVWPSSWQVT